MPVWTDSRVSPKKPTSAGLSPMPVTPSSVWMLTSTYSSTGVGRLGETRLRLPQWCFEPAPAVA